MHVCIPESKTTYKGVFGVKMHLLDYLIEFPKGMKRKRMCNYKFQNNLKRFSSHSSERLINKYHHYELIKLSHLHAVFGFEGT